MWIARSSEPLADERLRLQRRSTPRAAGVRLARTSKFIVLATDRDTDAEVVQASSIGPIRAGRCRDRQALGRAVSTARFELRPSRQSGGGLGRLSGRTICTR